MLEDFSREAGGLRGKKKYSERQVYGTTSVLRADAAFDFKLPLFSLLPIRTVILRTGSGTSHPEIVTHSHLVRFCFGSPLSFRVSEREQERLRCEVLARAHC